MNFHIPQQLQTERLTLRFFKEKDWRDIHEHYSDLKCTKYTFARALTEAESWRAVASEYVPNLPLISFIGHRNLASIKLAKSIGAELEKEIEFRDGKWHIYSHSEKSQ